MRIGVMLSMPGDLTGVAGLVRRAVEAEAAGFASAWLPQVTGLDALTVLAIAGGATSGIELGTSVVPTYPRHPVMLAGQALTVQDATGGRLALGIGLSHKMMVEGVLGLDYSRPVPHMREYLSVLNGLLAGERVQMSGTEYRVNAQLAVSNPMKPPVLVAALGPAMLRLCGRHADGIVTWMGGLPYLRDFAVPALTEAAKAAGRPAPRVVAMVPVALNGNAETAREAVTAAFRNYGQIPSYRAALDRGGAEGPADVALAGPEEVIETGLAAYREAGVTDFVAAIPQLPGANPVEAYEAMAAFARAVR